MNPCLISYIALCRAFELPAPWSCREADHWSLRGPSDPSAALATLVEAHTEEALIESGVVQRDSDGQLTIHPLLADPDTGFVILRDSFKGTVYNLMTETGCVFGDDPPMFQVLADKHTFDALAGSQRLVLLTDTLVDTILLRSFGLAAAPIAGLERLDHRGLELLAEYYGAKRNLSEREQEELLEAEEKSAASSGQEDPLRMHPAKQDGAEANSSPSTGGQPYIVPGTGFLGTEVDDHIPLILVEWIPHSLSKTEPACVRRSIRYLKELKNFRGLELFEIKKWSPVDRDIEAIRFALSHGEAVWAKDAILDSLYSGIGSIENVKKEDLTNIPPTDLATAIEQLHNAMFCDSDDSSRRRCKEALDNYHRVVARKITRPMLQQAETSNDPLDRAMQIQFAQLSALFLEKAPMVRQQARRGVSRQSDGLKNGGDKSVSELLAISSQLVTLAKEMMKCQQRNPKPTPKRIPGPTLGLTQRFSNSDLGLQN